MESVGRVRFDRRFLSTAALGTEKSLMPAYRNWVSCDCHTVVDSTKLRTESLYNYVDLMLTIFMKRLLTLITKH